MDSGPLLLEGMIVDCDLMPLVGVLRDGGEKPILGLLHFSRGGAEVHKFESPISLKHVETEKKEAKQTLQDRRATRQKTKNNLWPHM